MCKTEFKKATGIFSLIFFIFCIVLFSSCGMQVHFSLDPPVSYHKPDYSTSDYAQKYFEFRTASNSDAGEFTVLGTAVYYKIYGSSSALVTDVNSVEALNTSSNGSAAARKVIETLGYKQLGTSAGSVTPFISGRNSKRVSVRLMTYGTDSDYSAKVEIGGVKQAWTPLRFDSRYTFEFGRNDSKYANYDNNKAPVQSDEDVKGRASNGIWYVNMYAVSVGRDASYTPYYSLVCHLGSVAIDENSEDN